VINFKDVNITTLRKGNFSINIRKGQIFFSFAQKLTHIKHQDPNQHYLHSPLMTTQQNYFQKTLSLKKFLAKIYPLKKSSILVIATNARKSRAETNSLSLPQTLDNDIYIAN